MRASFANVRRALRVCKRNLKRRAAEGLVAMQPSRLEAISLCLLYRLAPSWPVISAALHVEGFSQPNPADWARARRMA